LTLSITMDAPQQGLRCRWAGCPEEFDDEIEWIKHVAVHVFTLKPGERTPWLGPPELNPDLQRAATVDDNQSDGEDDDDRAFSQINALSSPASTPPQVGLPDSPDLAEKLNGPSASAIATIQPLRLLSSDALERSLSHRTSASADDIEADLIQTSPTPSVNASLHPHILSSPRPMLTQTQSPSPNVNRFRRGVFQIHFPAQMSVCSEAWMNPPQSPRPLAASQTLPSPNSSPTDEMSWLNTQAFRPPETQNSYESD